MNKLYLGIDNGISGALALIDSDSKVAWTMPMPIEKRGKTSEVAVRCLYDELQGLSLDNNVTVVYEGPAKHSKGVLALTSTHECFGCVRTVLALLGLRTHIITQPRTWQKEFWNSVAGYDTKAESVRMAKMLWPEQDFLRTPKCKTPDNGITDALLIAEYGRRKGL
jgi:hypothetical protein